MWLHLDSGRRNVVSPAVRVQSVFVMREKRNLTPDICKASGKERKLGGHRSSVSAEQSACLQDP